MDTLTRCFFSLGRVFDDGLFDLPEDCTLGPFRLKGAEGWLGAYTQVDVRAFLLRFRRTPEGWVVSRVEINQELWSPGREGVLLSWLERRLLRWKTWKSLRGPGDSTKTISLGFFPLMGTYYHVKSPLKLHLGDLLVLCPRKDNAFDPWAVEVRTLGGQMLGFLPRGQNEIISRLLSAGKHFYPKIVKWDGKRVIVEIFMGDHP